MKAGYTIAASLFVVGLVINPAYFVGCAGDDFEQGKKYDFDYGEEEMLGVLDDINGVRSWTLASQGSKYDVELSLEQAQGDDKLAEHRGVSAWAQTAQACGYHEQAFAAAASACITIYRSAMPVVGVIRISRTEAAESVLIDEIEVSGEFALNGHRLEFAWAELRVEGGSVALALQGTASGGVESADLDARVLGVEQLDLMGQLMPATSSEKQ